MKYLLDTHAFLWALTQPENLSEKALEAIKNPLNEVFVSAVTFWEISIKVRIRKLDLGGLPNEELPSLAQQMDFQLLDLSSEEANSYGNLQETSHNDPFDRMLIWQCIRRNMTMVSKDIEFKKFKPWGLHLLWK